MRPGTPASPATEAAATAAAYREALPHGALGLRPGEATAAHGEQILTTLVAKYAALLAEWPAIGRTDAGNAGG